MGWPASTSVSAWAHHRKVDEWQAWLRGKDMIIYDDVTEDKYRSIKIKDPDGYLIEIFWDERAIGE